MTSLAAALNSTTINNDNNNNTNSNDNSNTQLPNELFKGYSDELLNFASVACIIFIIVGVPGNLLTIVALSRGKQTRRSTAIFIINLSLSDLLFGCFNLPLAASTFMQRSWSHGDLLCRLFPLLRYGLCAVSLFTVSLITVNRYVIIAHPRKYPRIYQRRFLALMVAFSWLLAFFVMIPTWQGIWGRLGLDIDIGSCSILPDDNGHSPKEFLFVIAFIVPCITIVFCYARIWYLVRTAASRTRTEPSPAKSPNIATTNRMQEPPLEARAKAMMKEDCAPKDMAPLTPPAEHILNQPFFVNLDDIEYIDVSDSNDDATPISYSYATKKTKTLPTPPIIDTLTVENRNEVNLNRNESQNYANDLKQNNNNNNVNNTKPLVTTSMTRFHPRKVNYVAIGNTSNASSIYPGRMSVKDRRLLKMILVIFALFLVCYLPITITKVWKEANEIHLLNISGYLLIYLTTCINPIIYVLMSSEYRRAYWRLLSCRTDNQTTSRSPLHKTAK